MSVMPGLIGCLVGCLILGVVAVVAASRDTDYTTPCIEGGGVWYSSPNPNILTVDGRVWVYDDGICVVEVP